MAKKMTIDQIEIRPATGHIQVRQIDGDGNFHRVVVNPADDAHAKRLGLTEFADAAWNDDIRQAAADRAALAKSEAKQAEADRKVLEAQAEQDKADKDEADKAAFTDAVKIAVDEHIADTSGA